MAVPELLRKLLTAPARRATRRLRPRSGARPPPGSRRSRATRWARRSRACRHGDGPLLVVLGHIDEIGVMVTHVDDEGFVFFLTVGGNRPDVLHGQRVQIVPRKGRGARRDRAQGRQAPQGRREARAARARGPAHRHRRARPRRGARAPADRRRRGGRGEPVELAGGRIASRSLDNRLGAYVALEAARRVAEAGGAPGDVVAVAAVQEEVGDFGGARTTRLRARAEGRARGGRDRRDGHPRRRPEARRRGQARRRPDRQPRLDDQPEGLRAAGRDGRGGGDRATPSTSRPATRTPTWTRPTQVVPGSRPG